MYIIISSIYSVYVLTWSHYIYEWGSYNILIHTFNMYLFAHPSSSPTSADHKFAFGT